MQDNVDSGFIVLSALSLSPSLPVSFSLFTLGLSDPLFVASLFGYLSGCSPDSTPPSGGTHVWSVVDSDPPCVLPPCHVSVRHVAFLMQ